MKPNTKPLPCETKIVEPNLRLAGGFGAQAAKQDDYALLRRATLASLLWEDLAYESGESNSDNIATLIPKVAPQKVADLAVETRVAQKLRHAPLLIAREMARHKEHNAFLDTLLPRIITRADQLTDFVALYFKDKRQPLTKKVKKGLAAAFNNFSEYQFAKYNRNGKVKLRDVLFLAHPKPTSPEQEALFKRIANNELKTPDTWEVALSGGADKKETFTRLIQERKLGGLAFLRNLRNMSEANVDYDTLKVGFNSLNGLVLLPLNFFAAQKVNPQFTREIEEAMLKSYEALPKLKGHTLFVVDVSGSMGSKVSGKSDYSRMEVAAALAMLASENSERVSVYVTAGSDGRRIHKTERIGNYRGFALSNEIISMSATMGGGGIFTRQCVDFLKTQEPEADRIIIFSDSQDCDNLRGVAKPFGKTNYIVDVSCHSRGVNYNGLWTAEVSGWSENFLNFVAALEGVTNSFED